VIFNSIGGYSTGGGVTEVIATRPKILRRKVEEAGRQESKRGTKVRGGKRQETERERKKGKRGK